MKILLLVQGEGYSFINQAKGLAKGLTELGIENQVVRIHQSDFPSQLIKQYRPALIVTIGSWHYYQLLVEKPQSLGVKVIPWIVSDGKIDRFLSEYNQLKLILTPSKHCQKIFSRDGISPKIIKVLPEAVDPDFWRPLKESQFVPILKLISISDPRIDFPLNFDLLAIRRERIPVIFTTGGDATSKGACEVIQALGRIKQSLAGRFLYLIKTWPSSGSFLRSAHELELAQKLELAGNIHYLVGQFSQEVLRALMNFCDIYIAPSRGEGFGLPLVEAQMCGKPVITLDANATREVVKHKLTGFLVRAKKIKGESRAEIDDLAYYLKLLLTDSSLRNKMGKQARIWALKNFSPKVIAQKFLSLID